MPLRAPYFGSYGGQIHVPDYSGIARAGAIRAQGDAAFGKAIGQGIGDMVEKYRLNKEKRAVLTGDIEAYLKENPDYINESTMTGDEAADKKNMTQFEKFAAGDLNMAGLEGLAGKLARGDTLRKNKLLEESQRMQNEMQGLTLGIATKLEDTTVQLQKDKATISGINAAIAKETNPQRLKLLQSQLVEAIANLGEGAAERALREKQRGLTGKQIDADISVLPSETKAREVTAEAVPGQVEGDTALREAIMLEWGGPEGYAKHKRKVEEAQLLAVESATNYRESLGTAAIYDKLAKLNPTLKDQLAPLKSVIDTLRTTKSIPVTIDGRKTTVSMDDYEELHEENSDKYPWTGMVASQAGVIAAQTLEMQRLLERQKVQAIVPAASTEPPAAPQGPPTPHELKVRALDQEAAEERRSIFDDPGSNIYLH